VVDLNKLEEWGPLSILTCKPALQLKPSEIIFRRELILWFTYPCSLEGGYQNQRFPVVENIHPGSWRPRALPVGLHRRRQGQEGLCLFYFLKIRANEILPKSRLNASPCLPAVGG
jgi:hypothetical protein